MHGMEEFTYIIAASELLEPLELIKLLESEPLELLELLKLQEQLEQLEFFFFLEPLEPLEPLALQSKKAGICRADHISSKPHYIKPNCKISKTAHAYSRILLGLFLSSVSLAIGLSFFSQLRKKISTQCFKETKLLV